MSLLSIPQIDKLNITRCIIGVENVYVVIHNIHCYVCAGYGWCKISIADKG